MEKKIKIAAVGDNCMDVYDNLGKVFPGGNPVNVAVYTVRLGGEACYIGAVGTDSYGKLLTEAVRQKGVDVSRVKVIDGSTAQSHVTLIDGERVFGDYDEGVMAAFKLEEEDIEFLKDYDIVVTGLWGKLENTLPKLKKKGIKTAFDFATERTGKIVDKAVPYTDYAFFSYDGGEIEELHSFMRRIYDKGAGMVIVTRGKDGSIVYDGSEFSEYGIAECRVVDTMGAGDSFIAGFLYSMLRGKTVSGAMADGAKNSSITLGYEGAW